MRAVELITQSSANIYQDDIDINEDAPSQRVSFHHPNPVLKNSNTSPSILLSDTTDGDSDIDDVPRLTHPVSQYSSAKTSASNKDISSRQISVARFKAIIRQSAQCNSLDLDKLVQRLQQQDADGTFNIPLDQLAAMTSLNSFGFPGPADSNDPPQGDQSIFDLIELGLMLADEEILQQREDVISPLAL